MNIKELLLKHQNFAELLKKFAIKEDDFRIRDEDVLLNEQNLEHREILKEDICIEGRNDQGIISFFGTLHCNLFNKLAVFEMKGFEQASGQHMCAG